MTDRVAPGDDSLGDRMKLYERAESARRLMPLVPAVARLDGRGFSRFTHGLNRPYDERLSRLMVAVTAFLVEETVARAGYTQSDEITLTWLADSVKSQVFFDGKVQKMTSQLAALATAKFNQLLPDHLPPEYARRLPTFDARVWSVPNVEEGANAFLWRELDAAKNSVSMAARAHYSHAALHGKSGQQMQEMLWQKSVNWNEFPAFFKRGTFVSRRTVARPFDASELDRLPEKHEARRNRHPVVERSEVRVVEMPPFGRVLNRAGVLYRGEEPTTAGGER